MFRDWQPWKMKSIYLPDIHRINSCKSHPHIHPLLLGLSALTCGSHALRAKGTFVRLHALPLARLGVMPAGGGEPACWDPVALTPSLGGKWEQLSEPCLVASSHF